MEIILVTIILGATILLAFYISKILNKKSGDESDNQDTVTEPEDSATATDKIGGSAGGKTKKKVVDKKQKEKSFTFQHPWLMSTLKGHSGRVLDMDLSPNGKHLASCAEDRTVLVWHTKDFSAKEHKCLRCNVEFDHGVFIRWSPDSKAFVVQKAVQNCTEVYKMGKKPDGSLGDFSVAVSFPQQHKTDTVGMGISSSGKFLASCSDKTDLIIWNLKGDVLERIDTVHNLTYWCQVSPCGKFVATSGFTSDVKVWEVKFSRNGEFEKVTRAFNLSGHTSGVYSFSFSADSSKVATVSKDGTWKVFNTAIEYTKGQVRQSEVGTVVAAVCEQDATVLVSGDYTAELDSSKPSAVTLSPDGKLVALSQDGRLRLYSVLTGDMAASIEEPHSQSITRVLFSPDCQYLFTSGDKHIRVFHNVPGIQNNIQELKETLQRNLSNSAAKERIQSQITTAEDNLKKILSS